MKVPGGCFLEKRTESRLATAASTGRGPRKGLAERNSNEAGIWGENKSDMESRSRVIVAVKDDPTSPVCVYETAWRVGKGRDKLATSLGGKGSREQLWLR
ncbi:hypothetical protein F1880_002921 [Penicillium rolfsii]|nr:hypothetical protein F1880_002921 [Penicillium rolfsii]